jgi:asparagine synthase (glutamine-hydrolysing)
MSGITGIFHYDHAAPVEEEVLYRMTERLRRRGSDGERFCSEASIGLGVAHRTIEEYEENPQPLLNEDCKIAVVFEGELYNAPELSRLLSARGYHFKSRSQAEIILKLYEDFGEACVTMLRGGYGFALWDGRKQQLLLARDRMGEKPLYYADLKGVFLFGSDLRSMLEHADVSQSLDVRAVADFFFYHYIPAPKTIYRRIRKLRPGHYLLVTTEGVVDREYWNIDFSQPEEQSVNAWCTQLIDLFYEAVELRMRGDVPVGVLLSSGLDASAVACMMKQVSDDPIRTAAFSFEHELDCETADAAEFAQHLGAEHSEGQIKPAAIDVLEKLAWHFDEPFADAGAVTAYYLFQAARERFAVALSGDGGDENFISYQRYLHQPLDARVRDVTQTRRRMPFLGALSAVYPKGDWLPHMLRGKSSVQQSAAADSLKSVYDARRDYRDSLLSGDLRMQLNAYDPIEVFLEHHRRPQTEDPIARAHYVGIKTHLADNMLTKLDRVGAATSLDLRCPLVDHRLMAFLAHIPSKLKMRGRDGKYLYKRALAGLLPPEILTRPKRHFSPPLAAWLRGDLRDYADAALFSQQANDGLLQQDQVARLWKEHQESARDHSRALWAVLMFRVWQTKGMKE